MFYLHPTASPARFVPTVAGVPDSQSRDLDRRRRLNRQLLSYRAEGRSPASPVAVKFNEAGGPGPA